MKIFTLDDATKLRDGFLSKDPPFPTEAESRAYRRGTLDAFDVECRRAVHDVRVASRRRVRMSICIRCLCFVDLVTFLANDFICDGCAGEPDSEFSQRTIASERQSTVPPEVFH